MLNTGRFVLEIALSTPIAFVGWDVLGSVPSAFVDASDAAGGRQAAGPRCTLESLTFFFAAGKHPNFCLDLPALSGCGVFLHMFSTETDWRVMLPGREASLQPNLSAWLRIVQADDAIYLARTAGACCSALRFGAFTGTLAIICSFFGLDFALLQVLWRVCFRTCSFAYSSHLFSCFSAKILEIGFSGF